MIYELCCCLFCLFLGAGADFLLQYSQPLNLGLGLEDPNGSGFGLRQVANAGYLIGEATVTRALCSTLLVPSNTQHFVFFNSPAQQVCHSTASRWITAETGCQCRVPHRWVLWEAVNLSCHKLGCTAFVHNWVCCIVCFHEYLHVPQVVLVTETGADVCHSHCFCHTLCLRPYLCQPPPPQKNTLNTPPPQNNPPTPYHTHPQVLCWGACCWIRGAGAPCFLSVVRGQQPLTL